MLIIDDDEGLSESLRFFFEDYDSEVLTAQNGEEGLEIFNLQQPDLVLVDLNMPKVDGHKVVSEIARHSPDTPVIVVSGTGVIKEVVRAINLGAWDFITKPILNFEELEISVLRALEKAFLIKENKNYKENLEHLVEQRTDQLKQKSVELEKLVEELNLAKEKAEASERLKTEFLTQISHEIRTPINALLNSNNMIRFEIEDNINEDIEECFAISDRAGKRLIRTIELLINMSELEVGSYNLHKEKVDLINLLQNIVNEYKISNLNHELKILFDSEIEQLMVKCDNYSTNQVFINLIDNAVKFTKQGEVEVKIERSETSIQVRVKDTGIGIAEDFLKNIFEPFSQEEQGYTRTFEGNGLGMALIKKYCDLNNFKINIESKKEMGTEVIVTINK